GNLTVHSRVTPELVKTGQSDEHLKQVQSLTPGASGSIDPRWGSIDPTLIRRRNSTRQYGIDRSRLWINRS
ncbi:unnamed protein product, partial [Arabidopsis halleri]